ASDAPTPSISEVAKNFCIVLGNYKLVLPVLLVAAVLGILSAFSILSVPWWGWLILLAVTLAGLSRFMWFLVIFTGYWIVFWQQYISLPGYVQHYVNTNPNVGSISYFLTHHFNLVEYPEKMLVTDGATVILLTIAVSFLTRKIPPLAAVILGTVITSVAWLILAFNPTVLGAVLSIFVM